MSPPRGKKGDGEPDTSKLGFRPPHRSSRCAARATSAGAGSCSSTSRSGLDAEISPVSNEAAIERRSTSTSASTSRSTPNRSISRRTPKISVSSRYRDGGGVKRGDAVYRCNRAAAMLESGKLSDAIAEYKEALRHDPTNAVAHHGLGLLCLRIGDFAKAREHLFCTDEHPDSSLVHMLQMVEKHMLECREAYKKRDWVGVLRESDAVIAAGGDSCLLLLASRARAFIKLHQFKEFEQFMSDTYKKLELLDSLPDIFGFGYNWFLHIVRATEYLKLGRFKDAESEAEIALHLDPQNTAVQIIFSHIKLVSNSLKSCSRYTDSLKSDPSNAELYYNRAVCYEILEQWQSVVDDCSNTLKYDPHHTKALRLRAFSFEKLHQWIEAARDYEVLSKDLPEDDEIANALSRIQTMLTYSLCKRVTDVKLDSEIVTTADDQDVEAHSN